MKMITHVWLDPNLVSAANIRAARYIHDKHPRGFGFDEVRDDILLEFYRRRDEINAAAEKEDAAALGDLLEEACNAAINKAANESRKNERRLVPYQVRNAGVYLEDKAYDDLARDMADYFVRQSKREQDAWFVRTAIRHLTKRDRLIAGAYMELGSWERVAHRFGRTEGDFRRHDLPGFIARFKEEWARCW